MLVHSSMTTICHDLIPVMCMGSATHIFIFEDTILRTLVHEWTFSATLVHAGYPSLQAYFMLDEMLLAGELQEPSKKVRTCVH